MDDARHFTDYRPNCHINNLVRANNKLTNQQEYRTFLTNHAEELMRINRAYACQKNCCGPCSKDTAVPHQTVTKCTKEGCVTEVVHKNGLGEGRDYGATSSQSGCKWEAQAPPTNSCFSEQDRFRYHDGVSAAEAESFPRDTVPSGGKVLSGLE